MTPLLAVALLLLPVLDEPGPVRVVAAGTGEEPVSWVLDGIQVATTADRQAARLNLTAGPHELWAVSGAEGDWYALARPEPEAGDGAVYVPAWTAHHPAGTDATGGQAPSWLVPAALAAAGLVLLWPRRRSKSP